MQSNDQARELLSRIWLFSEMSEAEIGLLAQIAQRRRYEARRVIVRQGDADGDLFAVLRGHLKVSACDRHGHEIVMSLMQPGEVFGEIGLLDGEGGRSATVTSLDSCELLVIRRADFLLVLRRSPSIASSLLTVLARRVRRLTDRAQDSAFLDVKSRLAKRLVDLADQFGTPLGPRQVALRVRLSQQELGDMVQATRESVNKCLREWAREGIIQRNGRQLVIEDRQRLGALAAG
ncbi:MAG TPA: Crp/Fnr family transcriptional regulator [Polyangiales bacterium]|nr:Crp/Fnr family transcriptional regulator [Polyangiales bacterium]